MSADYGVGEDLSSDTEIPRLDPEVFDSLKPLGRAIVSYAAASLYPSKTGMIIPFSFLWEGKETEFNVMQCLRRESEEDFYVMIRKKRDSALGLVRDSVRLQKMVDFEMEVMRLAHGANPEIPLKREVKIYLAVKDQLEFILDRTDAILEDSAAMIYMDAIALDFKDDIKKSLGLLHRLGRIESVPELLTTINEEVAEKVLGIADRYRLVEEDKLSYLMGKAEEKLK
jgi:hypothetical protein